MTVKLSAAVLTYSVSVGLTLVALLCKVQKTCDDLCSHTARKIHEADFYHDKAVYLSK